LKRYWVIPPEQDAEFVCAMEDVLEVYQRPYDPRRPQVCLDEASRQLVRETRTPMPAAPGRPATVDYEYERNGTANLFMMFEPLAGRRHVLVTERRTAKDYAHAIRYLLDDVYPEAEKVVLVQDNLNTHKLASLYDAFPPEEAARLRDRLEVHYTPKHGSWLDMAEIELGILQRQCLDRRLPDREMVAREVAAWQHDRNAAECRVNWRFTTAHARIRLRRLYPVIEPVNSRVSEH
jgi:DDE superfamily endonuclease